MGKKAAEGIAQEARKAGNSIIKLINKLCPIVDGLAGSFSLFSLMSFWS
jgi:hypothetical protein